MNGDGHVGRYAFFAIAFTLIIAGGLVAAIIYSSSSQTYELVLGLIIILGVSILSVLLFLIAAAFKALKLSDKREALGLPPGSVRAMIALLLILIWAIVSISVFRFVAFGLNGSASPDGIKLGQQLFTTMSTLVVAISAFYFGTSSAGTARRTPTRAPLQPLVSWIHPNQGKLGEKEYLLSITGSNFQSPNTVRLVQTNAKQTIIAYDVFSSRTEIRCRIEIAADQQEGSWDVIVENGDGGEQRLANAFQILS